MTLTELLNEDGRWELEPAELRDLLADREQSPFVFIDCREEDEHAEWRIGREVLMPLSRFPAEVSQHLTEPGRDPVALPLIVYCHHGMRSLQAAQYLRAKGFEKAYSLRGGIDAWVRDGNDLAS